MLTNNQFELQRSKTKYEAQTRDQLSCDGKSLENKKLL
jgi:hypothetical protein